VPHSSPEGKAWSVARIVDLGPTRILDVGPGIGTYVDLLRPVMPNSHWTGLEFHEPYVTRYDLTRKYDALIVGDVRAYTWSSDWDMVIFGDVLEHLDLPEAMSAWRAALRRSKHVLASIPIVHYPQGECEGNINESHRVTFEHELVMNAFPQIEQWFVGEKIGVYLAFGAP
jgi:trans-aconitate methyltransferase